MKKPKLEFQTVYVVENWASEIKIGVGTHFPSLNDGVHEYTKSNMWLVWIEGKENPATISGNLVYTELKHAANRLAHERNDYLKFCEKEAEKYNAKLKELRK